MTVLTKAFVEELLARLSAASKGFANVDSARKHGILRRGNINSPRCRLIFASIS